MGVSDQPLWKMMVKRMMELNDDSPRVHIPFPSKHPVLS